MGLLILVALFLLVSRKTTPAQRDSDKSWVLGGIAAACAITLLLGLASSAHH